MAVAARSRPTTRVARAAAAWAFLFATVSFAWAAGVEAGVSTLGAELERQARERDGGFVAFVWLTGVLKVVAGVLVLRLARLPRRVVTAIHVAAWLLLVYEAAELVQHTLMLTGAIATPDALGHAGVVGHVALWDPFWILGAALFVLATRAQK